MYYNQVLTAGADYEGPQRGVDSSDLLCLGVRILNPVHWMCHNPVEGYTTPKPWSGVKHHKTPTQTACVFRHR